MCSDSLNFKSNVLTYVLKLGFSFRIIFKFRFLWNKIQTEQQNTGMLWYLQLFDGIFVTDNTVMLFKELKSVLNCR